MKALQSRSRLQVLILSLVLVVVTGAYAQEVSRKEIRVTGYGCELCERSEAIVGPLPLYPQEAIEQGDLAATLCASIYGSARPSQSRA